MTDPTTDRILEVLERAMSDAPEPRPWTDVERRAAQRAEPPRVRSRTGVWLAVAGFVAVLLAGSVVLFVQDSQIRVDDDPVPATSAPDGVPVVPISPGTLPAPTTTDAPATTAPAAAPAWSGGLLDDVDVETLRPLTSFTDGDVIVPTAPSGWRVSASGSTEPGGELPAGAALSYVNVIEALPIEEIGRAIDLTLSREWTCISSLGCTESGSSSTINGVVWESFTDPGVGIRARLGDLWIIVVVPWIGVEEPTGDTRIVQPTGPLLADPTVVEFLEGLRVGAPADLAAIGEACWDCDGGALRADFDLLPLRLGAIDTEGLRPLDTLSPGDVLVPTAPSEWTLSENQIPEDGGRLPVAIFTVSTGPRSGRMLEVYVARTCDADATICPLGDNGFAIGWPLAGALDVGGVTWGYPPATSGETAAVIGDYVVAIAGTWFESRIPLLDEPDVLTFIEGLRVGAVDELPDQFVVVDARGTPIVD